MNIAPDIVNQLAVRCWKLNHQLNLAGVPQGDRDLLFVEITHDEVRALLQAHDTRSRLDVTFHVRSTGPDADGTDWYTREHLTGSVLPLTLPPVKGQVWASWFGIRLVWLGN